MSYTNLINYIFLAGGAWRRDGEKNTTSIFFSHQAQQAPNKKLSATPFMNEVNAKAKAAIIWRNI